VDNPPDLGKVLEWALPAAIGLIASFAYLGILAYMHLKARLLVDFYHEIGKQVDKQELVKKSGNDAPFLPRYQALQAELRKVLEDQGLLKSPPPKP
jgi:hypothetical protein